MIYGKCPMCDRILTPEGWVKDDGRPGSRYVGSGCVHCRVKLEAAREMSRRTLARLLHDSPGYDEDDLRARADRRRGRTYGEPVPGEDVWRGLRKP